MVSIAGLDRAEVLTALYNRAKAQGLGILHYKPGVMSVDEARELLRVADKGPGRTYFDYLHGRVMKVELKPGAEEINERLYDRDNGSGAMQAAIDVLRAEAK